MFAYTLVSAPRGRLTASKSGGLAEALRGRARWRLTERLPSTKTAVSSRPFQERGPVDLCRQITNEAGAAAADRGPRRRGGRGADGGLVGARERTAHGGPASAA